MGLYTIVSELDLLEHQKVNDTKLSFAAYDLRSLRSTRELSVLVYVYCIFYRLSTASSPPSLTAFLVCYMLLFSNLRVFRARPRMVVRLSLAPSL